MNPQTFLSNFGHIANAPDGVKSLRQLVMASALAGKFSVPNEELPSDIQIRLEEARSLYFRSLSKREKPLLFSGPLIHEFGIPTGWQWVRVGQVCDLQTGATPSTQRPEYWGGEIPWLSSGDVNLREIFECKGRITEKGLANSNCKILPKNCVLIALNGQGKTRATVALLRIPAACNQSLVAMIPFDVRIVTPEYLFLSLRYRYYEIRDVTGQDQRRGLNMGLVSDLSVPLAPLAEQKRIVAKVDELMALCDQLATQQEERERRFPMLSRTCHARFAEAPTPANLDRIFDETGTVSPADLRRTILALAVRGRLSRRTPSDGSAKSTLPVLASRALQTTNHLYPPQWMEVKLGEVGAWKGGGTPSKSVSEYWTGTMPWVSPKDMKKFRISEAEDHISEAAIEGSSVQQIPENSLLMVVRGMILGRAFPVALTTREVTINQDMKALLPHVPETAEFLLLALRAFEPVVLASIERSSHGTCKLLTEVLHSFPIPIPPLAEQRRIVAKVDELMTLVDKLEAQQQERDKLAEAFAKACVASFTGTPQLERPAKMKAPKTELVSLVTLGKKPKPDAKAPLAELLTQQKGSLPAKSLWQQSGLTIDAFYHQLKTEIAQGWIAPPAEAEMKVLEDA